jgi:hypothetical protein
MSLLHLYQYLSTSEHYFSNFLWSFDVLNLSTIDIILINNKRHYFKTHLQITRLFFLVRISTSNMSSYGSDSSSSSDSRYAPSASSTYPHRFRNHGGSSSSSSSQFTETRSNGRHEWYRGWHSRRSRPSDTSRASSSSSDNGRGDGDPPWPETTRPRRGSRFDWWS